MVGLAAFISDEDIRAKILQDLYYKKRNGKEILTTPEQYATLLGITNDVANFNIQYLAMAGLVDAQYIPSTGTTKRWWLIMDITSYGIEAAEGRGREGLAVNFNVININAPVDKSLIAAGQGITQTYSLKTFEDIESYVEHNLTGPTADALRSELRELRNEIDKDQVKPSRLQKIKELCEQYGATALIILEAIMKLLSKSQSGS